MKPLDKIEPEEMTSLEKACSTCSNSGVVYRGMDYKAETCSDCSGRGVVPNDLGYDVIKFLARYTK